MTRGGQSVPSHCTGAPLTLHCGRRVGHRYSCVCMVTPVRGALAPVLLPSNTIIELELLVKFYPILM